MAYNRLKANIGGTSYTIVSEEPISYMRDLVAQVDDAMTDLVKNNSRMSTTMAAVLTALQNADAANKERAAADTLRLEMKRAIDEQEHLRDTLAEAKAEVSRLQRELAQLRARRS